VGMRDAGSSCLCRPRQYAKSELAAVQVVEAVWKTQGKVGDVPGQLLPSVPPPTPPHFHLVPNVRRIWVPGFIYPRNVTISLAVTYQRPNWVQRGRERLVAAAAKRSAANALSLKSMFAMQLKVRRVHCSFAQSLSMNCVTRLCVSDWW
jgi:hypothetical protein